MPWTSFVAIGEHKDAIVAELEREAGSRRKVFPDRVAKGRMTEQDAAYQEAIWLEILANVRTCLGGDWRDPLATFRWREKVDALNRELDYRARLYPEWVNKGRLDQATADRRVNLVEAVRDFYWRHMFAWEAPAGPAADYQAFIRSDPSPIETGKDEWAAWTQRRRDHPGDRAFHEAVEAHVNLVDGDGGQQQELGL